MQILHPTAQLRSQPIGTSTSRYVSEGISRRFQVRTITLTQPWIFPGEVPNSVLQISRPYCVFFEILTHRICEYHKRVVLHHYDLGWCAVL